MFLGTSTSNQLLWKTCMSEKTRIIKLNEERLDNLCCRPVYLACGLGLVFAAFLAFYGGTRGQTVKVWFSALDVVVLLWLVQNSARRRHGWDPFRVFEQCSVFSCERKDCICLKNVTTYHVAMFWQLREDARWIVHLI